MILAVDVHYVGNTGHAAGVLFSTWAAAEAEQRLVTVVNGIAPYCTRVIL